MLYEVSSKRVVIDKKGNDKIAIEHFIVDNATLFGEAETAVLMQYNLENDVVAVKRSNIEAVINTREDDEQKLYIATIEKTMFEDVKEIVTREKVAMFAMNIEDATERAKEYMSTDMADCVLVGVKKSKFADLVGYLD